jgi:hypothetical protein
LGFFGAGGAVTELFGCLYFPPTGLGEDCFGVGVGVAREGTDIVIVAIFRVILPFYERKIVTYNIRTEHVRLYHLQEQMSIY